MNRKTNIYVFVAIIVIGIIVFSQSSAFDVMFSDTNNSETNENGILPWGIFFGSCISAIIFQIGKLRSKS